MAKKISAIIGLSLIGILIIATIIMANVKVDYSINCKSPDAIYINRAGNGDIVSTAEQKATIEDYLNNASKQISLTALFEGNINKKATVVEKSGTVDLTEYEYSIIYYFNDAQTMRLGNKFYETAAGKRVTFERLIFTIDALHKEEVIYNVFVINSTETPTTYSHYYQLSADLSGLYGYLTTLNNVN